MVVHPIAGLRADAEGEGMAAHECPGPQLLEQLGTRPSRQGEVLAVDTRNNMPAVARTFAK
jgi:hypothetical protein